MVRVLNCEFKDMGSIPIIRLKQSRELINKINL